MKFSVNTEGKSVESTQYIGLTLVEFFSSEFVEDVDLLIRRAERCLKEDADMIVIDADGVSKHADNMRGDIVAKIIGRLGLEKTMFEASNQRISEWFIKQYSPKVNVPQNNFILFSLIFPYTKQE